MEGLCKCGCGRATTLAKHDDVMKGWKKGEPVSFIHGHNRKGTHLPQKRPLISIRGEGHWNWKGGTDPERERKRRADRYNERKVIPREKLNSCMASNIYQSLCGGKNGRKWQDLVGYSVDQLRKHLEKRFTNGMGWGNHGSLWHIDHIIPISAFNFATPDDLDFKRCWELKNLRPFEAKKNCSKGARIDKPFQPSLTIR